MMRYDGFVALKFQFQFLRMRDTEPKAAKR